MTSLGSSKNTKGKGKKGKRRVIDEEFDRLIPEESTKIDEMNINVDLR